jgi:hypothetical protein
MFHVGGTICLCFLDRKWRKKNEHKVFSGKYLRESCRSHEGFVETPSGAEH